MLSACLSTTERCPNDTPSACECDGSVEAAAPFAVSCGESAEVFESTEEGFNAVAKFVKGGIVRSPDFVADLGWDHGHRSNGLNYGDGGVDAVSVWGVCVMS
jgi:hypothetical protein